MNRCSSTIVVYNNSVLLGKRAPTCYITGRPLSFPNYWSIFGGSTDEGENPLVCAQRELFEETEIKVELHQLNFVTTFNNDSGTEMNIYAVELDKLPKVVINAEHLEYGWFEIDSLDSFPYDLDSAILNAIKFYKKNKYTRP